VTEQRGVVAVLDVGVGPLASTDAVDEVVLVLGVGLSSVFGVDELSGCVVGEPAAAVPADIEESICPENLDPCAAEGPVGQGVGVADALRYLLDVRRPEGRFELEREFAVIIESKLRIGRVSSVAEYVDSARMRDAFRTAYVTGQEAGQIELVDGIAGDRAAAITPGIGPQL